MHPLQATIIGAALLLPQEPQEPEAAPTQVPERIALHGATLHTMVDGSAPYIGTVILNGSLIEAVLPEEAPVPEDATRLDVTGLHMIPGLIDGHVNYDLEHDSLYVRRGVSLVRDMGSVVHDILMLRAPEMRALTPGPDLHICGPTLSGLDSADSMTWGLPNPKAAREVLPRKLAELQGRALELGLDPEALSFDYLNFRPDLSAEVASALTEMARENGGLKVWGPVPAGGDLEGVIRAGQAGLIGLACLLPADRTWGGVTLEDLTPSLQLLAGTGVAVTPLLSTTARQLDAHPSLDNQLQLLSPIYEAAWNGFARSVTGSSADQRTYVEGILSLQRAAVHSLWKSGVPLLPGSGAPFELLLPGDALLDELVEWTRAGIPPSEVLRLATAGAADILGVGDERGRIAPGLIADLVLLGSAPDRGSLSALRDPELVVIRGQALERWDLDDRTAALIATQDAARERLTRDIDVPSPDMPVGEVLLTGRTQTEVGGQRLSSEHFAVVDLLDGRTAYGTRMMLPGSGPRPDHEVHLVQIFEGDRLQSFELRSDPVQPEHSPQEALGWKVEGNLAGESNRMNILRRHTRALYANNTADQPVSFVDYSDTLTALILGRHARAGEREAPATIYPLTFEGNHWEPVQDQWNTMVTVPTQAIVGQSPHTGVLVIASLDERGAPLAFERRRGRARQELRTLDTGGVGAPPKPNRVHQDK